MNEYIDSIGIIFVGVLLAITGALIIAVWPPSVRRDAGEWVKRVLK
jgi:hypothetical protein